MGSRRWIIAPPEQCNNTYLHPTGHPSQRHSSFDWAEPVDLKRYPGFAELQATEVILTEVRTPSLAVQAQVWAQPVMWF